MGTLVTIGIITIAFITSAVLLFCGKGANLIAGYNTDSDKEKSVYNEKKLCRAFGWLCSVISVLMIITFYLAFKITNGTITENIMVPFSIVFISVLIISIAVLSIYINKKCKK